MLRTLVPFAETSLPRLIPFLATVPLHLPRILAPFAEALLLILITLPFLLLPLLCLSFVFVSCRAPVRVWRLRARSRFVAHLVSTPTVTNNRKELAARNFRTPLKLTPQILPEADAV